MVYVDALGYRVIRYLNPGGCRPRIGTFLNYHKPSHNRDGPLGPITIKDIYVYIYIYIYIYIHAYTHGP